MAANHESWSIVKGERLLKLRRVEAKEWTWQRDTGDIPEVHASVTDIVNAVRRRGDEALREFTAKFDGVKLDRVEPDSLRGIPDSQRVSSDSLRVPPSLMKQAWEELRPDLQEALQTAARRIQTFHETQQPTDVLYEGADGERLGLVWRPLRRVGVYAPGGRAAYPSTVLMDVIPAKVAGVDDIALVSPPDRETGYPHPLVLAAAHLVGITEMYRVGGAQSVAALAYGTESIPAADKIVGPGNIFVAAAKRLVSGTVGIDSIAGPSEVFIIADETADPRFVAADMLAQAEHDVEAGAVAIVFSNSQADAVEAELNRQLQDLSRRDICTSALETWGSIIVASSVEEAIAVTNASAPEHLELLLRDADEWLPQIRTAGAVFLGSYSPEPVGDYYAGTNHVLPTHGTARYASGLGVYDFLRRMSYVAYQQTTLQRHGPHILTLAQSEGLTAHAKSVELRLSEKDLSD